MTQGHDMPWGLGREKVPIHKFKCQQCGNLFEYICFRSGEEYEMKAKGFKNEIKGMERRSK